MLELCAWSLNPGSTNVAEADSINGDLTSTEACVEAMRSVRLAVVLPAAGSISDTSSAKPWAVTVSW